MKFRCQANLHVACGQAEGAGAANQQQQPETFEVDQWIVDFAQLFREHLGVDPDRHLDLTNIGWEKLQVRSAHGLIFVA